MKKKIRTLLVLFVLGTLLICCSTNSKDYNSTISDNSDDLTDIFKLNVRYKNTSDKSKFKIAVVQSGEWYTYVDVFKSIINGFITLGWFKDIELANDPEITLKNYLIMLNKLNYSDYLSITPDNFFDFDWDDTKENSPAYQNFISNLDADLIISLGTMASQILSKPDNFHIPVLVESVSEPIESGILLSKEDSGRDYLTGSIDPDQNLRQIRLFHDVVKFSKLGIIYTDTDVGKSYAGYKDILSVSKEKNFEVIENTDVIEDPLDEDIPLAEFKYLKAIEKIAPNIDAFYLTIQGGLTENNISKIMNILNKYKIPTFAMEGSIFVKKGALLGESQAEFFSVGLYNAKKIVSILNGVKPQSLGQTFEHTPHIAINLKEAKIIDYDVPIDVIASSDEIYLKIGY